MTRLVALEGAAQDQVLRLRAFREQHPAIVISSSCGWWQAVVRGGDTEKTVATYTLQELLDLLEELPGQSPHEPSRRHPSTDAATVGVADDFPDSAA